VQGRHVELLGGPWQVIDVPGHTSGHIAFFSTMRKASPCCFAATRCSRAAAAACFEGTAAQMVLLDALAALPGNTLVCCAHEYTISNLRFAQAVEPNNRNLAQYLNIASTAQAGQPTLPSTLQTELAINPFMRSRAADVIAAAAHHDSQTRPESPPACWLPCANGKTFSDEAAIHPAADKRTGIHRLRHHQQRRPHVSQRPVKPLGQAGSGLKSLNWKPRATCGCVSVAASPCPTWSRTWSGPGAVVRQRPDYIQRMTERSSKYLFHIVEELERRGMPTELALLPFIESAFNPQAVSSAKAAGMWQFMPATGTYFDLKQNVFRDDRRDVLASTRAALDYLQKLYNMFGDWHLALAAYNWGEGSVGRAIKRNEKLGQPAGYLDLQMPAETRNYVPKLQAVKNIVAEPEKFNTELPIIENHPISRPWICRTTSTWSWWPSWPMSASRTSRHSTPAFTSR
jgi:hypothetical protein